MGRQFQLAGLILLGCAGAANMEASPYAVAWRAGEGSWADAAHWAGRVPDQFLDASVGGASRVSIPAGTYAVARLEVGTGAGDQASVELNGGRLLVRQDSLIIGEESGGEGTFILNDGMLQSVMDVFVGGATASTGRMNRAALVIRGGSLLGLTLTVGCGLGADSRLEIDGSRAAAVHALEFVQLVAAADPGGKPGRTTLAFTLDEHGVTPITIGSRWTGLEIRHDVASRCELRIGLSAVPPREEIPLIIANVAVAGTFDALPEGAKIAAEFGGRTYHWTLTYRGGGSGHDVVLQNPAGFAADAPVTHVTPPPAPPEPLWKNHPVYPLAITPGMPAFPGAEGYGAFTPGGRGGKRVFADNLDDSGPGSLRAALGAVGPRTVVFRVAGTIVLATPIPVTEPFLTLDASEAPRPGVTLRRHGLEVRTHDVVLRHFRIRIGDDDVRRDDSNIRYGAGDGDYALDFRDGAKNCIADHLSLSWSTNKLLSTTKLADLITIQWCILSESLNLEGHGYASITGGNRVTWHHNLFAHNLSRNVRFQGAVDADFRNNVIYDWGTTTAYGEFDRLNYVGNYLKPGPSTTQKPLLYHNGNAAILPGTLFMAGNVIEGDRRASADNWTGTRFYYDRSELSAREPFPAPPVATESAAAAFADVLRLAGATQPERDPIDRRIIEEVRAGTGRIVESVDEAGGWPEMEK